MVTVTRSTPTEIPLNKEFTVCLTARARCNCSGVRIKEIMPNGLTYVSSNPPASQDGCELCWDIGMLCEGECRQISINYRATEEGCHANCYSVAAEPICCQCIQVGCPELKISKCGPEKVRICCPVNYRITVTNCGSMVAKDVVVTDQVPEQLEHHTCMKTLCWRLGDMACRETRTINVCFRAVKCGNACNMVTAQACGCPPVSDQVNTFIEECDVCIDKTGPQSVLVGETADYTITATNMSNCPLLNACLIDTAPAGTVIKAAPGAEVHGNTATWHVANWPAKEKMTFRLTLYSCTPGCKTNHVRVGCAQGCCDSACYTTMWLGRPALWTEARPSKNPICVGDTTEICIVVQNTGSASDKNINVSLDVASEFEILGSSGATNGKISGNTVTFDTLPELQAGRAVHYSIRVKGVKPNPDARVKLNVSSEHVSNPVLDETSINIYGQ